MPMSDYLNRAIDSNNVFLFFFLARQRSFE